MLFPVKAVYESRRRILKDIENGRLSEASGYQRLRDIDPEDPFALLMTANLYRKQGNDAAAEEVLWRAVELQPGFGPAYFELAACVIRRGQKALGGGLLELSMRKELLDASAFQPDDPDALFNDMDIIPGTEHLSRRERVQLAAEAFLRERDLEPVEVTARLHLHRLIHHIQEESDLDRDMVDAVLKEGLQAVPLLVGLLRGWAREITPGEGVEMVENTLALLGEMGDVGTLRHLLEFVDLDDRVVSASAVWAIRRIAALHPEQARLELVSLSPGLSAGQRLALINALTRDTTLDPSHELLQALCLNTERFSKQDCDFFVPIAIAAIMTIQGRNGANLATSLLRARGRLISRDARSECESLIVELGNDVGSRPLLSPGPDNEEIGQPTVYDICSGLAAWDQDDEDSAEDEDFSDDEFEDDEIGDDETNGDTSGPLLVPPAPVVRAPVPGRNDKCWCGSGKKYKKCHLEADQNAAPSSAPKSAFDGLRTRLMEFLPQAIPKSDAAIGAERFLGSTRGTEEETAAMIDWMLHDWKSPKAGLNVIQIFLRQYRSRISTAEIAVLEDWSRSHIDLYEVQEVRQGNGLALKRSTTGEELYVHDIALSKQASVWDGILARVIQGDRGLEFTGIAQVVPRMHLAALLDWLKEEQSHSGVSGADFWKAEWPRVRRHVALIHSEWLSKLRLANSDGDPLLMGKSVFEVLDSAVVEAALRGSPALQIEEKEESNGDDDGQRFVWLRGDPDDESRTVLGNIRLSGGTMFLETNSKKRSDLGKALLADLAGPSLRHLRDEFTTQKEMKRHLGEGVSSVSKMQDQSSIPEDEKIRILSGFLEKHYSTWPDTPLPALGGRTPRQAVKSKGGKRAVIEVLKDIENGEQKKKQAGEPFYDVNLLRAELGLTK